MRLRSTLAAAAAISIATFAAGAVLADAVIGDGAVIGARCELLAGIRVFPGVELPDAGVRFSAES